MWRHGQALRREAVGRRINKPEKRLKIEPNKSEFVWAVCYFTRTSRYSNVFGKRTEGKTFHWLVVVSTLCIEWNGENCVEFADQSLGVTHRTNEFTFFRSTIAKWTNEFSNWTCVFTRPKYLRLSQRKSLKQLWSKSRPQSSIHKSTERVSMICITEDASRRKTGKTHRDYPFQKWAQIFVVFQLNIF